MYKFKHTIKLDDYSGASLDILIDENDRLSVRAVDLIGDAWNEVLEGLTRAEEADRKGRPHDVNRELQTAVTKLATHLDGVICGMCECLKRTLPDFRPPEYGKRKDCNLRQKIEYVTEYVQRSRNVALPRLDLTFKVLRDLLVHPYADKSIPSAAGGARVPISQGDVFDLTIADLRASSSMVDGWLGAVTGIFEYPRGYHTQRLAEDFTAKFIQKYKAHGGTWPKDGDVGFNVYMI
jgi:hypothetical protein